MHASLRLRGLRLGLAALTLALNAAIVLAPGEAAQAQSATQSGAGCGLDDYPIAGGWFYTQEARRWPCIMGDGPARWRGYKVIDDAEGSFWTEFRRYGGVAVLGYPVSQRYQYPGDSAGGSVYQAFERGILQWHPETQRAEMANVFQQFSDNGFDGALHHLGLPDAQPIPSTGDFSRDAEQHMNLLAEPQFASRYFYDPVAQHSSEPDRAGESAYPTQEQAWSFFGLPQSTAQRVDLTDIPDSVKNNPDPARRLKPRVTDLVDLDPLVHNFYAQRFDKAGLELFVQTGSEQFPDARVAFDPTIVPGDARPGCVVLTATGLLARTLGAGQLIPANRIPPVPVPASEPPHTTASVPPINPLTPSTNTVQISGAGFGVSEPLTVSLTSGQQQLLAAAPTGPAAAGSPASSPAAAAAVPVPFSFGASLPPLTGRTVTYADGSFDLVVTTGVGVYNVTVTGATSKLVATTQVNTAVPTLEVAQTTGTSTCTTVGLPTWN